MPQKIAYRTSQIFWQYSIPPLSYSTLNLYEKILNRELSDVPRFIWNTSSLAFLMCPLLLFLFIKARSCLFKPIYLLCFLEFKILSCRLKKKKEKTALPANVDTLGLVVKAAGLCSSLKETLFYQNNGIDYKIIIKNITRWLIQVYILKTKHWNSH